MAHEDHGSKSAIGQAAPDGRDPRGGRERLGGLCEIGSIVERQRDRRTAQLKYVVAGQTEAGENAEVVGRLSLLGKLIILTVYRA